MTKYKIELTDKQLQAISHACETCARVNMLQLDMLAEHIGSCFAMKEFCDIRDIFDRTQVEIRNIYQPIKKSEESLILWDIYQSSRYKLSWDRLKAEGKIKPDFHGVNYDAPMKNSKEPLMTIEDIVENKILSTEQHIETVDKARKNTAKSRLKFNYKKKIK